MVLVSESKLKPTFAANDRTKGIFSLLEIKRLFSLTAGTCKTCEKATDQVVSQLVEHRGYLLTEQS